MHKNAAPRGSLVEQTGIMHAGHALAREELARTMRLCASSMFEDGVSRHAMTPIINKCCDMLLARQLTGATSGDSLDACRTLCTRFPELYRPNPKLPLLHALLAASAGEYREAFRAIATSKGKGRRERRIFCAVALASADRKMTDVSLGILRGGDEKFATEVARDLRRIGTSRPDAERLMHGYGVAWEKIWTKKDE